MDEQKEVTVETEIAEPGIVEHVISAEDVENNPEEGLVEGEVVGLVSESDPAIVPASE